VTYVGVDIGTSVVKAAAFDEDGRQLALESAPSGVTSPSAGWFEQDADAVTSQVAGVVRRLVESLGGRRPELVSLTGQGDGVWLVDGGGCGVRPAVSWMDARAAGVLAQWQDDGVVEAAFRRTGGMMFPGCPAPLLAWLDAHEPKALDQATTAAYCKDVVLQRLTGVRATDASDASQPFLDPWTREYSREVLDLCGLAPRADLLAPVVEPVPSGQLTADAADRLGIAAGTPVTAGPFDLPACALGSGVTEPGDGHLIVGTTLACQVVVDSVETGGEPAGLTLAVGTPGRWLRAMPAMVGTAALDWVLATVGARHADVDPFLAGTEPGAHGVTCLPYFSPAGERAPFVESGARARFDGLSLHTSREDLVRAVCEGIAFAARHCFEAAGLRGTVTCCGGGARSREWLQLFADVLGREVRLAPKPEVGAYGAVVAGLAAVGGPAGVRPEGLRPEGLRPEGIRSSDMSAGTEPEVVVQPQPGVTSVYAQMYAHYRSVVDQSRRAWKERSA
jgi:erythritol kinase (D-erythritol 1-phosphate-forming)